MSVGLPLVDLVSVGLIPTGTVPPQKWGVREGVMVGGGSGKGSQCTVREGVIVGGQGRGYNWWGVREGVTVQDQGRGHSWWGVREEVTVGGGSGKGPQLVSFMLTVSVCEAVPTRTVVGQQ